MRSIAGFTEVNRKSKSNVATMSFARSTRARWRSSLNRRVATSALSTKLGTATLITNAIVSKNESFKFSRANGPPSDTVPQIANADSMSATVAVSR
jgi:hypothetical protein